MTSQEAQTAMPDPGKVANEIVDMIIVQLRNERGVHIETAVFAAASLAGTALFRFANPQPGNIAPGTKVFSEEVDRHGPELIRTLSNTLARVGIKVGKDQMLAPVPPQHAPQLQLAEVQKKMEPAFRGIIGKYGLDELAGAYTAAISCAILLRQGAQALDPGIGAAIAVSAVIAGSKTMPEPLPAV